MEGGRPAGRTVVRVLTSPGLLVIGIVAQSGGRPIVAFSKARDADLDDEDHVALALDPFGDGRSGYLFAVNPNGARYDAIITNQGSDQNDNWDAVWEAATAVTDSGWTAEIRIPIKSLSFPADQDQWRFNVERRVQAAQETDRWAGARRDWNLRVTAQAGYLVGLPRFDLGWGLGIRPAVTAGGGHPGPDQPWDGRADASLDLTQRITPNLLGTVTVNTDFAETEVDSRQVNLTRFPLFFPEKRTFFLEGSDVFDFGLGIGTDLLPFFSRRIGLLEGRQVPIRVGGKLNGQLGGTRIGAIAVRTGSVDGLAPARSLGVIRVRQNVLEESSVGGILTAGDPTGGAAWTGGLDATFRTSRFRGDRNLAAGLSFLQSDRTGDRGDRTAVTAQLDYPNDLLDLSATYKRIGDGFDPALGFVPRRAVQLFALSAVIAPRPERWGVRQMFFENFLTLATDLQGRWESYRLFFAPVNWRLESGDRFEVNFVPQGERLIEPFEVADGVTIQPGAYRFTRYRLEVESAARRRVSGQLTWWFGGFYDGTLHQLELEASWRPSSTVAIEVTGEHDIGRLPAGNFTTTVAGVRLRYTLSTDLEINSLIQYDDESRTVGSNSRMRWTITPVTELFLIYNHNLADRLDRWRFESNQLLAKLQYTLRR